MKKVKNILALAAFIFAVPFGFVEAQSSTIGESSQGCGGTWVLTANFEQAINEAASNCCKGTTTTVVDVTFNGTRYSPVLGTMDCN